MIAVGVMLSVNPSSIILSGAMRGSCSQYSHFLMIDFASARDGEYVGGFPSHG